MNGVTAGVTFGATTLSGNSTIGVANPVGGGTTLLTLGAMNVSTFTPTFYGNGNIVQTGAWGSGSGGITYGGTGTLALNQANTFTGTLRIGVGGTVTATGYAGSQTLGTGVLGAGNGAAGVTLAGGTLNLTAVSGINSNTGFDFSNAAATANVTVSNTNSTIISDVSSGTAGNIYTLGTLALTVPYLNIRGGGSVTNGIAGVTFGTTTLTGTALLTSPVVNVANPTGGGVTQLSSGAMSISAHTALTPIFNGNGNVIQTGVWSNGGAALGVTYNGTGSLTLNQNNTYTGTLHVGGGTVVAKSHAGALGAGTAALTLIGGNLKLTNASGVNLAFTNGATTVSSTSTITSDVNDAATAANTYTLNALNIGAQQLNVVRGGNATGTAGVTFAGITTLVTVSGAKFNVGANANLTLNTLTRRLNFWKTGAGTLTLASASGTRATGLAFVNEGRLVLRNAAATADPLGGAAAVGIILSGGSTLELALDGTLVAHNTTLLGSATVVSSKMNQSTGTTYTLGTLTSLGANTLTISAGSNIDNDTTGGVGFGAVTIFAPTTFNVTSAKSPSTVGAEVVLASLVNNGNTTTFTGAGDATVTGVMSGGGGLTMSGTGTLTLTGANTFGGATNINAGAVKLNVAAALGATTAFNSVVMSNTSTLTLNDKAQTLTAISTAIGTTIQNSGTSLTVLTLAPGANQTLTLAGTLQDGSGTGGNSLGLAINGTGAVTLSGSNTFRSAGGTGVTLTAGQLNINSNTAIGVGTLVTAATAGIIDNTSNNAVVLANNNAISLSTGGFTFGGTKDLSFGSGVLTATTSAPRTINLMGTTNSTLTIGTYNTAAAAAITTTVNALPGSNSKLSIGTFNSQASAGAAVAVLAGTGNVSITAGIVPTITGAGMNFSNTGTTTLTGTSTYTGASIFTAGTVILDASAGTAVLASTAPTFAGGRFVYHGADDGSSQSLGAVTLLAGGSLVQAIGGSTGATTLTLGTMATPNVVGSTVNFSVTGTGASITLGATTTTNGLISNGVALARSGAFTYTTGGTVTNGVIVGGTTSFATLNSGTVGALTGQTTDDLPLTGPGSQNTNYLQTIGNTALTGATTIYSLQLTPTGSQAIDLGGQALTINSGGLLYSGSALSTISNGTLVSGAQATSRDLIIHNFGNGGLAIHAVLGNSGTADTVTFDGSGVTTLSSLTANLYRGVTYIGGGATVSISAANQLGTDSGTPAAVSLNNGKLQVTQSLSLVGSTSVVRPVTITAGGGTIDVFGAGTTLTIGAALGNAGTGSFTKTGEGTLLLNGAAANYTGGFTYLQNGNIQLGGTTGALPTSFVAFGSSADTNTKLIIGDGGNARTQIVSGLATLGNGTTNIVSGGFSTNSTLTFTGTVAAPSTFSGTLGGTGAENNLGLTITAGQLTLSGANAFIGGISMTPAATGFAILNINHAGALGTGTLNIAGTLITTGTLAIDNKSGSPITLSTNNTVTLGNTLTYGGSNSLNFGSTSTVNEAASRTLILLGGASSTSQLTFGNWNMTAAALTLTVSAQQGSGTSLNIGTLNINSSVTGGTAGIIAGNGRVNVTNKITATAAAQPFTYSGTGTLTLSGSPSDYGGLTSITGGGLVKLGAGAPCRRPV